MASVYLIRAGETDNYKIGISENIEGRIRNIQTSHYEVISIVCSIDFDTRFLALAVEEELHKEYNQFNTIGEWFTLGSNQVEDIKNMLSSDISEVISLKARIKELENIINSSGHIETNSITSEKLNMSEEKQFNMLSIVEALFNGMDKDNKLTSKTKIIDVKNRTEDRHYKEVMEKLKKCAIVEFKRGYGYYAIKSKKDAIEAIKGV